VTPGCVPGSSLRTPTVSEIPHRYVKEAIDRLYGREEKVVARGPDPGREERRQ
jgi:hypothetical protein